MRVSEVMTEATVTDSAGDTLAEASRKMWKQQTGSLLVVDEAGELIGIITERDMLRAVATGVSLESATVAQVMSKDLTTVQPGTTLREAAKLMADNWIRHLPVVDGGKVVGIISQRDLSGVLAEALNEPDTLAQLVAASSLARERRLRSSGSFTKRCPLPARSRVSRGTHSPALRGPTSLR
jgi:CBS domain-containing protein